MTQAFVGSCLGTAQPASGALASPA